MTKAEQLIHLGTVLEGVDFIQASVASGEMRVLLRYADFVARFEGLEVRVVPLSSSDHFEVTVDGIEWQACKPRPASAVVTVKL